MIDSDVDQSKITRDKEIVQAVVFNGLSISKVGDDYGINRSTVCRIVSREVIEAKRPRYKNPYRNVDGDTVEDIRKNCPMFKKLLLHYWETV